MRHTSTLFALSLLLLSGPVLARPGGWGAPGWGESRWDRGPEERLVGRDRSREGRIETSRFVGDRPDALGHGAIAVSSTGAQDGPEGAASLSASLSASPGDRAAFEAAVVDQLVHAGYDTQQAPATGGQLAELTVTRTVVEPAEAKRKPVSGSAAMSVGTGGSAYGLALNVDLSKPLPPLVSTRLEARIRDRSTGTVLWEGRAEVATREGDDNWTRQAIAARLAQALFAGFPRASDGA